MLSSSQTTYCACQWRADSVWNLNLQCGDSSKFTRLCIVNKYGSSTETYDEGLIGGYRVIRTKVMRDPESGGDVLPRCVLRLLRTRNEREQTRRGKERKTMNPL